MSHNEHDKHIRTRYEYYNNDIRRRLCDTYNQMFGFWSYIPYWRTIELELD
jgi:hypothetical protein